MKRLVWIGVFTLATVSVLGQGLSRSTPDRKFYFGGGGSFGGGTTNGDRYTYYALFPIIGYRVTPQFSAGTGFTYQHYSYPDYNITQDQYGVSPFLLYRFDNIFFQTEFDFINSPLYYTANSDQRQTYNRWLFGIGYGVPLGSGRTAINAMVMYDVLYHQPSVFQSPVVARVFVTF